MQVTLTIPDEFAESLAANDPARAVLEAIAVEGYRMHRLNESQARRMLSFATRIEVRALPNAHKVCLHYSPEHLALDVEASEKLLAQRATLWIL